MSLAACRQAARRGRLYPAVILHGGDEAVRRGTAVDLGRLLLCEAAQRPCGVCRQVLSEFAPDLRVIVADLTGQIKLDTTLRELLPYAFDARSLNLNLDPKAAPCPDRNVSFAPRPSSSNAATSTRPTVF